MTTWMDQLNAEDQYTVDVARSYVASGQGSPLEQLVATLAALLDAADERAGHPLEQLVATARAAGAAGIWLMRQVPAAGIVWSFDPNSTAWEHSMLLTPPHPLIIVIRFGVGDGGESGMEFRQ